MKHNLLLSLLLLLSSPAWAQTEQRLLLLSRPAHPIPATSQQTPTKSARQAAATTIRYVKAGASGTGASWSNASGDLQAMINASASGDQVWIAGGTYKPNPAGLADARTAAFSLRNGVSVLGGFTGETGSEGNAGTRTAIPSSTTLSGDIGTPGDNSDNTYHVVFNNNGIDNSAILDGVAITAGNANESGTNNAFGGGVYNYYSSPTYRNCLISQNAGLGGGGMVNAFTTAVTVINCWFVNNTSSQVGGVFDEQTFNSSSYINCYFENNSSGTVGAFAGLKNPIAPTLINCTFRNNRPSAIYAQDAGLSLINGLLWDNGGARAIQGSSTTVSYSLLEKDATNYTDGGNNKIVTFDPFDNATGPELKSCAPAIDAGNNDANTTATDVLGNARKVRTIDMGAAEFGASPTQALTLANPAQSTTTVCAGGRVDFSVDVRGTGPFVVEFFQGNTSINGRQTVNTPSRIKLGAAISQTGSYQFVVTSGCNSATTTYASITVSPLPTRYSLTGSSRICEGSTGTPIGLAGSQTGVSYQLLRDATPVGDPVAGTGSAISFGNQTVAGVYTVLATNTTTSCQQTMSGSLTLTVAPLPTQYAVTGGGSYCAGGSGVGLGLAGSQTGVSYRLLLNGNPVGSAVTGTGSAISFGNQTAQGTYSVLATNTTSSCQQTMSGSQTVTTNPLPNVSIRGLAAAYCQDAPTVTLAPLGNPPGGLFTIDGSSATALNPATLSVGDHQVRYSYTDNNSCTNSATQTVTVKPTPTDPRLVTQSGGSYPAGVSSLTISQNTGNVILTVSGCAGGSISWNGGNSTTLAVSTASLGTQSFTATCTSNGCTSPTAKATVTVVVPTLKVLSRDPDNGQLSNNTIKPYLLLQNAGITPIPYSTITLRYWLTTENNIPLLFQKNYVQIGQGNLNLRYVALNPARQGATGYIEYSFSGGAGSLAPNGDSGPLEVQASKQDYSRFVQSDDYSYINNSSFTLNARITAYQNGVIFYGTEPSGNGSGREAAPEAGSALSVKVLGNPVVGSSAEVEISGVGGQAVQVKLVDLQGKTVHGHSIQEAGSVERVSLPVGHAQGILVLEVSTATQRQQVKLLRP